MFANMLLKYKKACWKKNRLASLPGIVVDEFTMASVEYL